MSAKHSLLKNIGPGDVITEPFPHVCVKAPLKDYVHFAALRHEFPDVESRHENKEKNTAYRINMKEWHAESDLYGSHPGWHSLIMGNPAWILLSEYIRIFGHCVEKEYGEKFAISLFDSISHCEYRGMGGISRVTADWQFVVNTPTNEVGTTVRDYHVDNPVELFAGLWYMAQPDDVDNGGDLDVMRQRHPGAPIHYHRSKWGKGSVDPKQWIPVERCGYQPDTLFLFMNTPRSVHGVTNRKPNAPTRKYVNIIVEVDKPLFELNHV